MEAFIMNPLGYMVAFIMILTPVWITGDILVKRKTLYDFYCKLGTHIKQPKYAIPLIILVLINWIWNLTKGL